MIKTLFIASTLCLCTSCAINGLLYTDIVVPVSDDFTQTPIGTKVCYIDDVKLKEPFSGFGLSAEWMSSSIYEKAREAGLEKIYYADMRILSVFRGIYKKQTLIVYGD